MLDFDLDFDFGFDGDFFGNGEFGNCLLGLAVIAGVALVALQNTVLLMIGAFLFLTLLLLPKSRKKKVPEIQKLLLLLCFFGLIVTSCWGIKEFQDYQKREEAARIQREIEEQKQEEENRKLGVLNRAKTWLMGTDSQPITPAPEPILPVVQEPIAPIPFEPLTPETAPVVSQNENTKQDNNDQNEEAPGVFDRIKGFFKR